MEPLDEKYYYRKCYIETKTVPTQSVMKKYMKEPLAKVYFWSMNRHLKVLAGLEPVMKGGGNDWYQSPEDLLNGYNKLVPVKKSILKKLGSDGIESLGYKFLEDHRKSVDEEIKRLIAESTKRWKAFVTKKCDSNFDSNLAKGKNENSQKIKDTFSEFEILYLTSMSEVEKLLRDASIENIKKIRDETNKLMLERYQTLLKEQQQMLQNRYAKKYADFKNLMKIQFLTDLDKERTDSSNTLHDIHVEKHTATEQLRNILECRNLACQMYVACKEKERFVDEVVDMRNKHVDKMHLLYDEELFKDIEIETGKKKQQASYKIKTAWQRKVCLIVKKFKLFVSYCLRTLPEQSQFFMNVEKILVKQMNEALRDQSAECLLYCDDEDFKSSEKITPITPPVKTEPYIVVGEFKENAINEKLCPKPTPGNTVPVYVINDRYIYAACEDAKQFPSKMRTFLLNDKIHQSCDEDLALKETTNLIKDGQFVELYEKQLESSLMKVLGSEIFDVKNVSPSLSCRCIKPTPEPSPASTEVPIPQQIIFTPPSSSSTTYSAYAVAPEASSSSTSSYKTPPSLKLPCGCSAKSKSFHGPCTCPKVAMKSSLPPYMWQHSPYQPLLVPPYEPCDKRELRELISKKVTSDPCRANKIDVAIQYIDIEFLELFELEFATVPTAEAKAKMDNNMQCYDGRLVKPGFRLLGESMSYPYLFQSQDKFARERMVSLAGILKSCPDLRELFDKKNCERLLK